MKIAQVTCVYPPTLGGIGQVAFQYAKYLSQKHQVTVFTPRYTRDQKVIELPGVRVELLAPKFSTGNAAYVPQITKSVKAFDVVHLHYPFFGAQELLAFNNVPKMVVTYHMVPRPSGLRAWWAWVDSFITEKKLSSKVKTWLVSSSDYAERYVRPRLGQDTKIEILPFGADDQFTVNKSNLSILGINLKPNIPVILFVGGLDRAHYFKGVHLLLKALASLSHKNWQLLVVGDGELKNEYIKQAKNLNLDSRVFFTGRLGNDDLIKAYNVAQLFILPSLNEAEAFGLAAVEAMACGLPIIASYLPGLRSLITTGDNGILVNPGDIEELAEAINFLIQRPDLATKFGNNGRLMVNANYRWPPIIARLEEIYNNL